MGLIPSGKCQRPRVDYRQWRWRAELVAGHSPRPGRGECIGLHSGCPQRGRQMLLLGKQAANRQRAFPVTLFANYFVKLILMHFFRTWSISSPRNDLRDGRWRQRKEASLISSMPCGVSWGPRTHLPVVITAVIVVFIFQ